MTVQARELDGRFVGFCTRVAEKSVVHAGYPRECRAELFLLCDVKYIGDMQQFARLFLQRLRDCGVGVSQVAYRQPGKGIEVLASFGIPQPRACATFKRDRLTVVCIHQVRGHRFCLSKTKRQPHLRGAAVTCNSLAPQRRQGKLFLCVAELSQTGLRHAQKRP